MPACQNVPAKSCAMRPIDVELQLSARKTKTVESSPRKFVDLLLQVDLNLVSPLLIRLSLKSVEPAWIVSQRTQQNRFVRRGQKDTASVSLQRVACPNVLVVRFVLLSTDASRPFSASPKVTAVKENHAGNT